LLAIRCSSPPGAFISTAASVFAGAGVVIAEVNIGGTIVSPAVPGCASDFVSFDTANQGGEWTVTIDES